MSQEQQGWELQRRKSEALRRKLRGLLSDSQALIRAAPGDTLSALHAISRELVSWEADVAEAGAAVRDLLQQIEPRARVQAEQFEEQLAREISKRGYVVHGDGSSLVIEGIVHVEVDMAKLRATVNGSASHRFDPVHVTDIVAAQIVKLRKGITPAAKMLGQLLIAYELEIKASGRTLGAQVTTENILMQLVLLRQSAAFRSDPQSRNFRDYPREQFRADLFALFTSGESETQGRRLRYAAGSDKAGAIFMLVPSLQRAVHLGRFWFEGAGP